MQFILQSTEVLRSPSTLANCQAVAHYAEAFDSGLGGACYLFPALLVRLLWLGFGYRLTLAGTESFAGDPYGRRMYAIVIIQSA